MPTFDKGKTGLTGEFDAAANAMKEIPWTTISELRGDTEVLAKIEEVETLLRNLRKSLT